MDRPDLPQQKLAGNSALFIFPLCVLLAYLIHSPRITAAGCCRWQSADRCADVPAQRDHAGVWLVGSDNSVFVRSR
nr:hypothetical protein [Pseudomonas aeruginosa]